MNSRRSVLLVSAQTLGAIIAGCLAVAVLPAVAVVPWPTHRVAPLSTVVEPAASPQLRACPGPLLSLGANAAAATSATSYGSSTTTVAVDPASARVLTSKLADPGNRRASTDGQPSAISVESGAVSFGLLAGASSQVANLETARGFAAASCVEPSLDSWLVGGSTSVGRTTLVSLANPSDVAATVDLAIAGEEGDVLSQAARGILVPPRTRRIIPLSGLAPNLESPVIHVTSSGGPVAATLQYTSLVGLVPAGVEMIGPTAAPATTQFLPGFLVTELAATSVVGEAHEGTDFPALRLYSPSTEAVQVSVGLLSESGGGGTVLDVTLQPGRVSDIPLGNVQPGSYTVRVQANAPVVAAARAVTGTLATLDASGTTGSAPSLDVGWMVAPLPLLRNQAVAVPAGPSPVLHLMNPGTTAAAVTVTVSGTTQTLDVPPGMGSTVSVGADTPVLLAGTEGLYGSVSFAGVGQVAGFGVQPPGPQDSPIRVYPR
ncbi:MAG: hypothetical protein B5766_01885 [Candidatus Lumbricidophila eiseniae]|uniref:Large extracellular alpha-helical protein n=1 Tax=Candidatus Lumbricidiphila eiseniae TaxID=1969409 RepID=A0A2A6FTJ1_9MICO|nr:MAG: hypothetical protein B5766_01885 [Candidatus Lumbricidophila eiseniae]